MKLLAWCVAAFVFVAGVASIVSPVSVFSLRSYAASQSGLLTVAAIRIAIGVVLIMAAPSTRAPKMLQAIGGVLLLAGLATPLFGVERTKAVLDWEAAQGPGLIRLGGAVLVAIGAWLTFALMPRRA